MPAVGVNRCALLRSGAIGEELAARCRAVPALRLPLASRVICTGGGACRVSRCTATRSLRQTRARRHHWWCSPDSSRLAPTANPPLALACCETATPGGSGCVSMPVFRLAPTAKPPPVRACCEMPAPGGSGCGPMDAALGLLAALTPPCEHCDSNSQPASRFGGFGWTLSWLCCHRQLSRNHAGCRSNARTPPHL